jgi:hypothetical protein
LLFRTRDIVYFFSRLLAQKEQTRVIIETAEVKITLIKSILAPP